jgi:hypothetical protein
VPNDIGEVGDFRLAGNAQSGAEIVPEGHSELGASFRADDILPTNSVTLSPMCRRLRGARAAALWSEVAARKHSPPGERHLLARLSISARLRSEWRRWWTKPSAPWRPRIANCAREELTGVDVISVGPLLAELGPGGVQCSVVVIVPERSGVDFAPSFVMLDIAQDPFMANAYRIALVVSLEDFFGRVQVFGDGLTLAKYCQKEWPSERAGQAVAEMVRNRGLTKGVL